MYIRTYIPLNGLPFLLWSGHTGHPAPLLCLCAISVNQCRHMPHASTSTQHATRNTHTHTHTHTCTHTCHMPARNTHVRTYTRHMSTCNTHTHTYTRHLPAHNTHTHKDPRHIPAHNTHIHSSHASTQHTLTFATCHPQVFECMYIHT